MSIDQPSSEYGDYDYDDEFESQLVALEAAAATKGQRNGSESINAQTIVDHGPRQQISIERDSDESADNVQKVIDSQASTDYEMDLTKSVDELNDEIPSPQSLWERFRKNRGWGALSVSDLVGPSWCEVQHSYRLESRAHLPPSERPTAITTSSGVVVPLDSVKTVAREQILDKGRDLHKVKEVEVMGDAVKVEVVTAVKEEWWALRILNTIMMLHILTETGKAREVSVMGFVDDFLVFGVIDEIERREVKPLPATSNGATTADQSKSPSPRKFVRKGKSPKKGKGKQKNQIDESQTKLGNFFAVKQPNRTKTPDDVIILDDSEPAADTIATKPLDETNSAQPSPMQIDPPIVPPPDSRTGFVISDTKTRYRFSIPPKSESLASRLQLMLYHKLFKDFITPHNIETGVGMNWPKLFAKYSLDPETNFSEDFLTAIKPIYEQTRLEIALSGIRNLNQLIDLLSSFHTISNQLEPEMEICYVMRETRKRWKPRKTISATKQPSASPDNGLTTRPRILRAASPTQADEEEDFQRALKLSLEEFDSQDLLEHNPLDGVIVPDDDVNLQSFPFPANPNLLLATETEIPLQHEIELPSNSQANPSTNSPSVRYGLRSRKRKETASNESNLLQQMDEPVSQPVPDNPISDKKRASSPDFHEAGSLIGIEKFDNDPRQLADWLQRVVGLWKGEREPEGVSLAQTSRCRTCEFEEGCEWLKMKSREAVERNRERKAKILAK